MEILKAQNQIIWPEHCYVNGNWKCYSMEKHAHGGLEINYILEGTCTYIVGDKEYRLKRKNMIVIEGQIPHQKIFDRNVPCTVMGGEFRLREMDLPMLSFSALTEHDGQLGDFLRQMDGCSVIEDAHLLIEDFGRLHSECQNESREVYIATLTNKFLMDTAEAFYSKNPSVKAYIVQIKEYIRNYFCKLSNIQEIAGQVHLNATYMERIFKREAGCTIWQYVMECRMNAARDLLENSQIPIGEIDLLIGMNSRQTFYIQFKRRFGVSPAEYRKLYHKEKGKQGETGGKKPK